MINNLEDWSANYNTQLGKKYNQIYNLVVPVYALLLTSDVVRSYTCL